MPTSSPLYAVTGWQLLDAFEHLAKSRQAGRYNIYGTLWHLILALLNFTTNTKVLALESNRHIKNYVSVHPTSQAGGGGTSAKFIVSF